MNDDVKHLFRPDGGNSIHDGIEHEPGGGKALLDHQTGLFQNVKDIEVAQLRANVTAPAKLAALHDIPVITTATWNRSDAAALAQLYCLVSPSYLAVMESYEMAQAVLKSKA